jgi:hypothetical protein
MTGGGNTDHRHKAHYAAPIAMGIVSAFYGIAKICNRDKNVPGGIVKVCRHSLKL